MPYAEDELDQKPRKHAAVAIEDDDETPKTKAAVSNDDDVEFGDEATMAKGDGFDKLSPPENDKSRVIRVALLTDVCKPKKAWIHFVTNKGSFRCASERDQKGQIIKKASCCTKLDSDDKQKAQLAILVLAFWYKNADPKSGKYSKKKARDGSEYLDPIEWDIGYIKLSRSGFRRVSNAIQEDSQPHEMDLMISWKENGIGFEYNVLSTKPRFRQNSDLVEEVMEAADKYKDGSALSRKLGKVATALEWQVLLSGGKGASSADDAMVHDASDLDV